MRIRLFWLFLCLLIPLNSFAKGFGDEDEEEIIPIVELTEASLKPQCVKWKLKSVCVWLSCGPFGCSTPTSMKVSHWSPDIAVEVRSGLEETPLGYTALTSKVFGEVGKSVMSAFGVDNFSSEGLESSSTGSVKPMGATSSGSNVRFYDAVVVGNPAILAYDMMFGVLYGGMGWCASPSIPLNIYYDSLFDAYEWRVGFIEALNSFTHLPEFLGPVGDFYGELYPRIGATIQPSPYKAASTLAYRAAHIATESLAPHLSVGTLQPYSRTSRSWRVNSMSNSGTPWSNVLPSANNSCVALGNDYSASAVENSVHSDSENYLKIMWRQHTCCYQRGQKLLAH